MEKNLITEIRRISELIGIENNILLNESAFGQLFANVAEAELIAILRAEVKNAITNGLEVVAKGRKISPTEDLARQAIMKKIGGKSLSASQKSGIRVELIRLAQEEAEAATKQGSKELADRSIVINIPIVLRNNSKQIVNGITKRTRGGANKTIKAGADDLAKANKEGLEKVVREGGGAEVEQMVKKGLSFKEMVKKCGKWGLGITATGLILWWILSTMKTVPDDLPVTPPVTPPRTNTGGGGNTGGGRNRYTDCTGKGTYKKGCKTSPTGVIGQVQACLGLTQDGRFWVKTQAALEAKGFSNGFTDADITKICGNQTLTPPTPEPNPDETIDTSQDLVTDQGV